MGNLLYLGDPAWTGVLDQWSQKVPAYLNHSVIPVPMLDTVQM